MGLVFSISNFLREGIGLWKKISSRRYLLLRCWLIKSPNLPKERGEKVVFLTRVESLSSNHFFSIFLQAQGLPFMYCVLTPEHGQKLMKANKRVSPTEVRQFSSEMPTPIVAVGGSAMTKTPLSNCSKDSK